MVRYQFFNIDSIPHTGYVYGSDHTKLPIQVTIPRSTKPIWPWLTTLIDFYSRVVLGFKLTAHTPTAEDNLDVFLEGIYGWETEDGVFVGGKPNFIRTDRGGDYISKLLSKNLMDLDIGRQFTAPYASWMNGTTERLNGSVKQSFAPTIYGYHPGGQEAKTRRTLQVPLKVGSLIPLERLDRRLADWFVDYNNRPHSSLGGLTPLEAWAADPHQTETADMASIVNAMNIRGTRTLHKYGIEMRSRKYTCPDLALLRKANVREVQVAYHERQGEGESEGQRAEDPCGAPGERDGAGGVHGRSPVGGHEGSGRTRGAAFEQRSLRVRKTVLGRRLRACQHLMTENLHTLGGPVPIRKTCDAGGHGRSAACRRAHTLGSQPRRTTRTSRATAAPASIATHRFQGYLTCAGGR